MTAENNKADDKWRGRAETVSGPLNPNKGFKDAINLAGLKLTAESGRNSLCVRHYKQHRRSSFHPLLMYKYCLVRVRLLHSLVDRLTKLKDQHAMKTILKVGDSKMQHKNCLFIRRKLSQ